MIFTRCVKSHNGRCDAMYTNPPWFMENGTGSCLLGGPAGKVNVYLWGNFYDFSFDTGRLVNTSVPFNGILCDPAVFGNTQTSDLLSGSVANTSNRYLYHEIWQTDQICHKIVMFPRKDLSSKISVCLIFSPSCYFCSNVEKKTHIEPFLPCLYLFQSVNFVVLTPLHGLRKLSLQRTAIPRSITGPFRSSHRGLLAEKLCWYGFQQASGENEAAWQKTWIITRSTTGQPPYCGGRVCVPRWPSEACCWGRLQRGSPKVTLSRKGAGGKIVFKKEEQHPPPPSTREPEMD